MSRHSAPSRAGTVAAVLPAYNLESTIGSLVAKTRQHVDWVVVVADGSRDHTDQVALQAGATVPPILFRRGKGLAIIRGLAAARRLDPDCVVLMDADGQHQPEEIPVLLEPLRQDRADMVVGSRMLGTLRTSWINRIGNWGLKVISLLVTGKWLTDTESGFRAFRGAHVFGLNLESRGYEIESELLLRALHQRWRVVEVPIHVPVAVPGVTVWDGVKVAWHKVRLAARLRWPGGDS